VDVIREMPAAGVAVATEEVAVTEPVRPHAHGFMELVVVASGTGLHQSRPGSRRVRPGDVVLVRPGQWHAYDNPVGLLVWNLYISASMLTGQLGALRSEPLIAALVSARLAVSAGPAVKSAVDLEAIRPHLAALALPGGSRVGDEVQRLGHLLVVLGHVVPPLAATGPDAPPRAVHPAVIAATELMHASPQAPWTLPVLARRVHVSAPYLCRCFTRDLGISPLRYLERHRLELVARLLLETRMPVSEIGSRAGMPDPNYLARRFRAWQGLSPSRYRATLPPPDGRGS
jgi:AraC family transcriptional regulator, L-rhamnose operon transcriptional activator RhaR